MTSQPAVSSAQISSSVAWTSRVSVLVIDCTVIGASPPTFTLPIWICRVLRRVIMSVPSLSEESKRVDPHQVVVQRVHHQQHEQDEAELLRRLTLPERQRTPHDRLDQEEEQMPPVEHRDRQQVQQGQVD